MLNLDPSIYDSDNWCAIDVETTGRAADKSADLVCMVGIEAGGRSWAYKGGSLLPPWVVEKISSYAFLCCHNSKFEAGWLKRCGIDTRKLAFWCTYTAEWVLRGGLPAEKGALSLDGCMERRSAQVKHKWITLCIHKGIRTDDLPMSVLLEYCHKDVALCRELFVSQKQELLMASNGYLSSPLVTSKSLSTLSLEASTVKEKASNGSLALNVEATNSIRGKEGKYKGTLIAIQFQRSMLAPVLADIEMQGLQLDKELTKLRYQEAVQKKEELSQKLYTLTNGINLGSNKQLSEYLYQKLGFTCTKQTAKGANSTSIGAIEELEAKTEEQRTFKELYFEYNDADQVLSKYLSLFNAVVDENDGLLFGSLNQGTTATHRLSSSGVPYKSGQFKNSKSCQFQNVPRDLKELFVARNQGWMVGEIDGSQLEFRVAAGLANDPIAVQEIIDLVDVHSVTAQVLGVSRQDAKPKTFGPMFGGNGKTRAERKYAKFFREKYKGIHKMQQGWCHSVIADKNKKLYTDYGMIYNFPNARMQNDGYIDGSTNIYNYGIQGLATAEIVPIALAWLWHNLPDDGSIVLVNTVHDSIIAEVRPDRVELWRQLGIKAMVFATYEFLERVYGYRLNVPLGIGEKTGERWGDKKAVEHTFQNENGVLYEIIKRDGRKEKVPYAHC